MSCTTDRRLIFTIVLPRKPMRFVHIYYPQSRLKHPVPQLFCRLGSNFASSVSSPSFLPDFRVPHSTPFTTINPGASSAYSPQGDIQPPVCHPTLRAERTALVVSSTSWTADENFGLLVKALEIYNRVASAKSNGRGLPRILMVITGKGPLKDEFMDEIQQAQKNWGFVKCISVWLDTADYPLLLGLFFPLNDERRY